MEVWKDIVGFDGYQVSNIGRVKSVKRFNVSNDRILKGGLCSKGKYRHVNIKNNEGIVKFSPVHRLVSIAFIENPRNLKTVNHKNFDSLDNRVENLEWCSSRENNSHMRTRNTSSKYTGVSYSKSRNKYAANIKVNGKAYYLGRFKVEEDAAKAYLDALNRFGIVNKYASNNGI